MRSLIFFLTTTALIGAAACSQAETSAPAEYETKAVAAASATAATETAAPVATQEALPQLTGSYWDARKVLLAQGYTSANETTEGRSVCVDAMEQEREIADCPSAEVVLPEVEDCAGTGMGQCLTLWRSPGGRTLRIVTVDGPQPGVISTIEWAQN